MAVCLSVCLSWWQVLVKEAVGAAGDHDKIQVGRQTPLTPSVWVVTAMMMMVWWPPPPPDVQELFPKTFGRPRVELAQSSKDDNKKA